MGSIVAALCWDPNVPPMYLVLTIVTMFNAWATLSREDIHWPCHFAFFLTNLYCMVSIRMLLIHVDFVLILMDLHILS